MLAYVDKHDDDKQPFFIYYCPLEPHVAMQPPREWVERYPEEWDSEPYRGERAYQPHPRPHAGYAATIAFMDYNVGQLLVKLKQKGLEDNTLVIFTSDNGTTHDVGGVDHEFFNSVSDLRGLKGSEHEGGIRVPGIIRWPGKVIDLPAYSADIMPTLCTLTGADPGKPYGENLLPVLVGKFDHLTNRRPPGLQAGGLDPVLHLDEEVLVVRGNWGRSHGHSDDVKVLPQTAAEKNYHKEHKEHKDPESDSSL